MFILVGVAIILAYFVYETLYFKSKKFLEIKEKVQNHIQDCNDLNQHIEEHSPACEPNGLR